MPCYNRLVVDQEGKINPVIFKKNFFSLLEHYKYDYAENDSTKNTMNFLASSLMKEVNFLNVSPDHCELLNNTSRTPENITDENKTIRKKLKLVVDLDNTLVHAQSKQRINNIEPLLVDFRDANGDPELFRFKLPKHNSQAYFVKLRPGVIHVLKELSNLYELAVHTNATQEYADVVLSILDPDRTLSELRIAARDDENARDEKKNMNRLFGSTDISDSMIILDDRRDVWDASLQKNILQCHYYEYFESRREILHKKYSGYTKFEPFIDGVNYPPENRCPPSVCIEDMTSNRRDESFNELYDDDRQLYYIQNMFIELATKYYNLQEQQQFISIVDLLAEKKKSILSGCVILMTGYHKSEQVSQYGMLDNGPLHRKKLENMGAIVVDEPSTIVTHVVIIRYTISFNRTKSLCGPNTKFVHNLWIYACEQTWTLVDEEIFSANMLLKKYTNPPLRPAHEHWSITKNLSINPKNLNTSFNLVELNNSRKKSVSSDEKIVNRKKKTEMKPLPDRYQETIWAATTARSEGAEIWSAVGHTTIHFDPFIVGTIKNN